MDNGIFKVLARIQGEEDAAAKADLMEQSNQLLGEHFKRNPFDLQELAYDIVGLLWQDVMKEDITSKIIEVKNIGLGEIDYVEEDLRGGRAYWQGKGGQILSSIIRQERSFMPREEMVAAIDLHQDEITTNFWGTFEKLRAQYEEKLRQLPPTQLVELIKAAITGGSFFGEFAVSSLTAAQIDSVVDPVAARSKGGVTIIGTEIATRLLAPIGLQFGPNLQEQIFNTGQIGVYKGRAVVQVENFEDFNGRFVLPNDELWIVGNNAGRLTYYGDQKTQILPREAFYQRWESARDAGMLLYGAAKGRIGRISFK